MPRVLVVDNDDGIRETARVFLEDAGYEVLEARDGEASLQALLDSPEPLVVLLDIVMPRVDGIDVLRQAQRDGRLNRHAFVVWTASRAEIPAELLSALRVPLVCKPFDLDDLLATVSQAASRIELGQ